MRALFLPFTEWDVPNPPSPIPVISISAFTPGPFASLLENLGNPIVLSSPSYFESNDLKMYWQGIVVYETTLQSGTFTFDMIAHDHAILFVDGNAVGTYDRSANK